MRKKSYFFAATVPLDILFDSLMVEDDSSLFEL